MEQNNEMTARQSLALISETLNNSRKSILRNNAKYYILWGGLLTAFSLAVFLLWRQTGSAAWNFLWFAMPVIGYPLAFLLGRKDVSVPKSFIGNLTGKVWAVFAAFSITLSALAVTVVPMPITFLIILLLGVAESISGVILKNWPIIICGFILGVGGAVAATMLSETSAQMLLFTFGGVLLAATGLIVKYQYR